jgi:hypothetical protein
MPRIAHVVVVAAVAGGGEGRCGRTHLCACR